MPRFNQRLFASLDAAAERTGIPAVARGTPRRRHLRRLPIVALLASGLGFSLAVVRPELAEMGNLAVMLGFALAVLLPILGPIKPWGSPERVDEFDQGLRNRAFFAGFATTSIVAMLGIWAIIGVAIIAALPSLTILAQLRALAFTLLTLHSAVPTLYASWTTRPIEEDD